MDQFSQDFIKILEPVTKSDKVKGRFSIRDLYDAKKTRLKLSDRQIQRILDIDRNTLCPILDGTAKQVNVVNIIKLAHFLGLSVNDMLSIYMLEAPHDQIKDIDHARKAGYIIENFDVATLTKIGFFPTKASSEALSQKIIKFFGLNSIYEYSTLGLSAAFSRTKHTSDILMRDFWINSAYIQFDGINNPNPYNRKDLVDLIPKIRPYTRNVQNGLTIVLKALYSVGVTVIFQRSLDKTQVRGATMIVHDKPCIVLSDFNKQYPTLWFTLMHELYHVLYDFDDLLKQTYHVSNGEGDLFLTNEVKADSFASEYLLSDSRLNFAKGYLHSSYFIDKLAKDWAIHPSIIYARHCYSSGQWALFSKYIPKMDLALEKINTHPFDKENLMESVKEIKEMLYNF